MIGGEAGPKRVSWQERFLWLPSDPRVTVSRGPADGGSPWCPVHVCPGPSSRLCSGSGEEDPLVTMSTSGLVCEAEAGCQDPGPSPSLSTTARPVQSAPSLPGPREPVVSWAQLSKVWGPQRVAWRQAHTPKTKRLEVWRQDACLRASPAGPHSDAARWGARPGVGAGQARHRQEPVWEEGSPGQAAGKLHLATVLCSAHPAWTDRRTQPHSSGLLPNT